MLANPCGYLSGHITYITGITPSASKNICHKRIKQEETRLFGWIKSHINSYINIAKLFNNLFKLLSLIYI